MAAKIRKALYKDITRASIRSKAYRALISTPELSCPGDSNLVLSISVVNINIPKDLELNNQNRS